MNNFLMSSDEDDNFGQEEIPFAQRVAQKMQLAGKTVNLKKSLSSAFSVNEDDSPSTPPSKTARREPLIEVTPPPEWSPYQPPPPAIARTNSGLSDLPDTEELLDPENSLKTSSISRSSSAGSLKVKKMSKEEKELEKKRKEEEKQQKKQQKDLEKKSSKAAKDAEKLVNKQTDKSEVNKYLVVFIDPAAVSCPAGSEILNHLQNPPSGKEEHIFQFKVENLPVAGSLMWKRKILSYSVNNGNVNIKEHWQDEGRAMIFVSAEFLVDKIADKSLNNWAVSAKKSLSDKHITLMVFNYLDYFKHEKNARERVKTASVRGENPSHKDLNRLNKPVTKYDFEEAVVSLSLDNVVDYLTFDKSSSKGWKDLAGTVFHQTRAVAEAPLKLKKGLSGSGGFSFWARADSKDCVDSKNLSEYWKQMLMQVEQLLMLSLMSPSFVSGFIRSRIGESVRHRVQISKSNCSVIRLLKMWICEGMSGAVVDFGGQEDRQCSWWHQEDWA